MKSILFVALASLPVVAQAQTAPAPAAPVAPAAAPAQATATVGAAVVDSAGAQVGTVEAVTPQAVLINTGTTKVGVAPQSLTGGAKGLTIAMTKAQLDAAGAQQQQQTAAALQQKLVPGAPVAGTGGANVGTVKTSDGQFVTVTTPQGDVKLPIAGFAPAANGVVVGLTQAQIQQATAGGTASSASAGSGTAAAGGTTTTTTSSSTTTPAAGTTDATTTPPADTNATTTTTTKSTKRTRRSN